MLKPHTYKRIVFPENSVQIIEGLLTNFGFEEDFSKAREKIQKGQRGFRMIASQLVKQAAEEKWPTENLAARLSVDLGLEIGKALQLANEFQIKIIAKAQEIEFEEEDEEPTSNEDALGVSEETEASPVVTTPEKLTGPDPYREMPM